MTIDTLITNGTIVTENRMFEASVAIDNGKIVAIGDESQLPGADTVVDAEDNYVMPGLVDPHVHIDDMNAQDTYETASKAAAIGGVTTFIDFAWQGFVSDNSPWDENDNLPDLHEAITEKQEKAHGSLIDYGLHAVVTREELEPLEEIPEIVDRGVTSVKMFTTYDIGISNGFIHQVMDRLADFGAVAVLHTEDPSVCEHITDQFKREEKGDSIWYPRSRPDYAEAMAAEDAVRMAVEAGCKYYGIHTSSKKAADELARFRSEYGPEIVRAETCTHYTALDDSIYEEIGTLGMIAPPIRTQKDIESMFNHLEAGTLDVVSTDHNSYYRREKDVDNWWEAPFGAASLQYSFPIFHHEAVNKRGMSYPEIVRILSANPARIFGLPQKGTLAPGTDADIIIFDPDDPYTVTKEDNEAVSDYTIYEGREVTGTVKQTFMRGELIANSGTIVGEPGHGSYIERELPNWNF